MTCDRIYRIGRWLAVLLLVAQFGAEMHVSSHALADPVDRMGQAKSCSTCLASSQLQNAVAPPTAGIPVFTAAWAADVAEAAAPESVSAPFRAYRSRAPPVLA